MDAAVRRARERRRHRAGAGLSRAARIAGCPLCEGDGGRLVWRDAALRVILADEPQHPAFVRVVWADHVAEMTDLAAGERDRLMHAVWQCERVMRDVLAPDKINVASFGNAVPHLHWHVVARWRDDLRFPGAVWAPVVAGREAGAERRAAQVRSRLDALCAALATALAAPQS